MANFPNLRELARRFAALPDDFGQLYSRVRELQADLASYATRPPSQPPPPFVCVLVEGEGPNGRTTFGRTGRLRDGGGAVMLECQPNVPMRDCRVTVFADLERVDVGGVFLGTNYVHAALGTCPIAFFAEWPLGVWLRVQALVRTENDR